MTITDALGKGLNQTQKNQAGEALDYYPVPEEWTENQERTYRSNPIVTETGEDPRQGTWAKQAERTREGIRQGVYDGHKMLWQEEYHGPINAEKKWLRLQHLRFELAKMDKFGNENSKEGNEEMLQDLFGKYRELEIEFDFLSQMDKYDME